MCLRPSLIAAVGAATTTLDVLFGERVAYHHCRQGVVRRQKLTERYVVLSCVPVHVESRAHRPWYPSRKSEL